MLIKLSLLPSRMDFFIRADLILVAERNPNNPLETLITTSLRTPQGVAVYLVAESPEAVSKAILEISGKGPSGLGLN